MIHAPGYLSVLEPGGLPGSHLVLDAIRVAHDLDGSDEPSGFVAVEVVGPRDGAIEARIGVLRRGMPRGAALLDPEQRPVRGRQLDALGRAGVRLRPALAGPAEGHRRGDALLRRSRRASCRCPSGWAIMSTPPTPKTRAMAVMALAGLNMSRVLRMTFSGGWSRASARRRVRSPRSNHRPADRRLAWGVAWISMSACWTARAGVPRPETRSSSQSSTTGAMSSTPSGHGRSSGRLLREWNPRAGTLVGLDRGP